MNYIIIVIIILAIAIHIATHLLVPLNIKLSRKLHIVAQPNERKINQIAIPEAGGLSFALPIIIAELILASIIPDVEFKLLVFPLIGVELITLILGITDDRWDIPALLKLLWQIGIGIIMYLIEFRVMSLTNPFGSDFMLGWLSFPVTIIWYLVLMNAINLIDGIDGLASGICVIVCAVLLVVGIKESNSIVIALSAFLLAGNLAFLRFNFYPAKIFLGDTGALFNGLVLAAISTAGNRQYKGITSMTLIIPLSVLAVPLIDMFLAIFRRIRGGNNIFTPDKKHLHHIMLSLGLSQRMVAIIVYFMTLLFGLIAIGFSFSTKKILFSVLLCLLTLAVVVSYIFMRKGRKE